MKEGGNANHIAIRNTDRQLISVANIALATNRAMKLYVDSDDFITTSTGEPLLDANGDKYCIVRILRPLSQ